MAEASAVAQLNNRKVIDARLLHSDMRHAPTIHLRERAEDLAGLIGGNIGPRGHHGTTATRPCGRRAGARCRHPARVRRTEKGGGGPSPTRETNAQSRYDGAGPRGVSAAGARSSPVL